MGRIMIVLAGVAALGCADRGGGRARDAAYTSADRTVGLDRRPDAARPDAALPDAQRPDAQRPDAPGLDARDEGLSGKEAAVVDLPPPEASAALDITAKSDKCVPGCHWDCFGGAACKAGKVYQIAYGAHPCCTFSDPWPYPGPVCSAGSPVHGCSASSCAQVDKRYASCMFGYNFNKYVYSGGKVGHLLRLHCPGVAAGRAAGDPCSSSQDCRPVKAGGPARLVCDGATSKCIAQGRPAAPAGYGASCGLAAATYPYKLSKTDQVLKGATCSHCHAVWDPAQGCVRQACTTPCQYDEDCPKGSVCLCPPGQWGQGLPYQFCAEATGRSTVSGRTAGLKCPSGAKDAGPG